MREFKGLVISSETRVTCTPQDDLEKPPVVYLENPDSDIVLKGEDANTALLIAKTVGAEILLEEEYVL